MPTTINKITSNVTYTSYSGPSSLMLFYQAAIQEFLFISAHLTESHVFLLCQGVDLKFLKVISSYLLSFFRGVSLDQKLVNTLHCEVDG